jgi:hypothetical protein
MTKIDQEYCEYGYVRGQGKGRRIKIDNTPLSEEWRARIRSGLEVYHRPGSWAADEFYRPIKLEEEGLK